MKYIGTVCLIIITMAVTGLAVKRILTEDKMSDKCFVLFEIESYGGTVAKATAVINFPEKIKTLRELESMEDIVMQESLYYIHKKKIKCPEGMTYDDIKDIQILDFRRME